MACYAVGDLQGCYRELMDLLEQVGFNPKKDQLWLVGDLVSRGPASEQVLKFLFENKKCVRAVLGNHDLHLIAIYYGVKNAKASDRLNKTLKSKARHDWIDWLRTLPLFFYDKDRDVAMFHAGLAPTWTLAQASRYSAEVETVLQSDNVAEFLSNMYGNAPAGWRDNLKGEQRLRCIVNYFTRTRILNRKGDMEFAYKGDLSDIPNNFYPWFRHPDRKTKHKTLLFGHWASIGGYVHEKRLYGLDTGCVWGRMLTMLDVDKRDLYMAQSQSRAIF